MYVQHVQGQVTELFP